MLLSSAVPLQVDAIAPRKGSIFEFINKHKLKLDQSFVDLFLKYLLIIYILLIEQKIKSEESD